LNLGTKSSKSPSIVRENGEKRLLDSVPAFDFKPPVTKPGWEKATKKRSKKIHSHPRPGGKVKGKGRMTLKSHREIWGIRPLEGGGKSLPDA